MDLTDRQRKFLFAALVVLLVAAGVILTIGTGSGGHKSKAGGRAATSPSPSAVPSTLAPVPTGPPPSPGSYDIYSMLPFSQNDFKTAADVARRFTIAYGTYRYDEDPKAYLGRLQSLVTAELAPQLQPTPATLQQRQQDQEVSTSDARLDSLRFFSKDQLIFVVTGTQHITKGGKTSDKTEQYAVTTTRSGGGWVVYAFRPADEGDN
ncbi:hypothetical protein GCM10023196_060270 [Actinoallomurus vinaceus]|uniref:Mce-associated membrane protein n=1 Tax=Actinoallomurus vinaceus TaxID=1080074 RepID=A0ABP8UG25_9ACTN